MRIKLTTYFAKTGWFTARLTLCVLLFVSLNRVAAQTFIDATTNQFPGLPGLSSASVGWADYDGDGLVDVLITGYSGEEGGNGIPFSKLYRNTGKGFEDVTATQVPDLHVQQLADGSVAWADYDGDKRPDFIITGNAADGFPRGKLFHNTGSGFKDASAVQFPYNDSNPEGPFVISAHNSAVGWGDYDNDGRPDLLVSGSQAASGRVRRSYLFHNTPNGFMDVTYPMVPDLPGLSEGALAWADYDQDGWLDFVITGGTSDSELTLIFHNDIGDGGTGFHETRQGLQGVYVSAVGWGDYDNDGRPDLLVSGSNKGNNNSSRLYHNTADDGFVDVTDQVVKGGLPGLYWSGLAWGDYDRDGHLDFLITGGPGVNSHLSRLYHNMGKSFEDVTDKVLPGLPQVTYGSVTWADYDNDKRLDFFIAGSYDGRNRVSRLYHNEVIEPCQTITITQQPASGSLVCADGSVSTSVSVNGSGATYQWYKDGAVLSKQTSATLTLDFVDATNAGNFVVVVTDCNSLTSTTFSLTVGQPLTITQQPASGTHVCAGGSISTSVTVNGLGGAYQWYKDGVLVSGQTSATLTLTKLKPTDVGDYVVVISGCNSLTSTAFSLTVNQGADLTSRVHANPTTLYGNTNMTVVVDVIEINGVTTTGLTTIKIPKDSKLSLDFPVNATVLNNRPVENSAWNFDPISELNYYVLTAKQPVDGGERLSFGLNGVFKPQDTSGKFFLQAIVLAIGACETVNNDDDGEKIDYFPSR